MNRDRVLVHIYAMVPPKGLTYDRHQLFVSPEAAAELRRNDDERNAVRVDPTLTGYEMRLETYTTVKERP